MNLVEKVAKAQFEFRTKFSWDSANSEEKQAWKDDSTEAIKVIKENIHEVAEICPECGGESYIYATGLKCNTCKGHGIIAKE